MPTPNTPAEPLAYKLDELPWSRATSYRMEKDKQLKIVRVRGRAYVTAPEARRVLGLEAQP